MCCQARRIWEWGDGSRHVEAAPKLNYLCLRLRFWMVARWCISSWLVRSLCNGSLKNLFSVFCFLFGYFHWTCQTAVIKKPNRDAFHMGEKVCDVTHSLCFSSWNHQVVHFYFVRKEASFSISTKMVILLNTVAAFVQLSGLHKNG